MSQPRDPVFKQISDLQLQMLQTQLELLDAMTGPLGITQLEQEDILALLCRKVIRFRSKQEVAQKRQSL